MDTVKRTSDARLFWLALILVTVWKVMAAARVGLCYDEGYYHFWSLSPQLSYFDHPPLVAWAMFLSGLVFHDSLWTVRIWPLFAGTAFTLIGRALAGAMFGGQTGNRAGLFLLLIPAFIGNGLLMTPDTLFALCWAAALYFLWRALDSDAIISWWWILTGLSAGVGFLSKYNMVLFFIGLAILWIMSPGHRKNMAIGGIVCAVIALVLFLPVVIWNVENHWVSFSFQLRHGFASKSHSFVKHFSGYLGSLLLLATPMLGLLALRSSIRGLRVKDARIRYNAVFCVVIVGFFGIAALRSRIEPNWLMLTFFSGAILVAHEWPGYSARIRRATMSILIPCVVLPAAYLLLPAQFPLAIGGRSFDIHRMKEFSGGSELASAVGKAKDERALDFVYVSSHQLLGRMSFYEPGLRPSLCPGYDQQYRFPWIDCGQWAGRNALIVSTSESDPELELSFRKVERIGEIVIPYKRYLQDKVFLYFGEGYLPGPAVMPQAGNLAPQRSGH